MRRLMTICLYVTLISAGVLLILFGTELLVFHSVLGKTENLTAADAIVVFSGTSARFKAGYELAKSDLAPHLIVSPANTKLLKRLRQQYGLPASVENIVEDKARTTFENALFTQKLVAAKGFNNVILVTSFYHMPRAYLLLRLVLSGSDVTIQTFQVKDEERSRWQQIMTHKKLFHNEMVELWGSLLEALRYALMGRVPGDEFEAPLMLIRLKKLLTFRDVKLPN